MYLLISPYFMFGSYGCWQKQGIIKHEINHYITQFRRNSSLSLTPTIFTI